MIHPTTILKSYCKKITKYIKSKLALQSMVRFYSQFIQPEDLCFDIGANIGNRTETFLKLGARVVAVEPQSICLEQLNQAYGENKSVTIVGKAVASKEGFAEISLCKEAPTISTMSNKWKEEGRFSGDYKWASTQKVATTTLDALIEEYGTPKFCKIDVEGFEKSVLDGLSSPIPFISFEFTREFFEDTKQCIKHLQSIGKVEFNCSTGESMELFSKEWLTPKELYKRLEDLDDILLWGDIYARFA
ncbi:MAG: FkbM family methyltransferase [Candidatus Dojkabacteria bacterium]